MLISMEEPYGWRMFLSTPAIMRISLLEDAFINLIDQISFHIDLYIFDNNTAY